MKSWIGADDPEVPVWASYTDIAMSVIVVLLLYLFTQAVYATMSETDLVHIRTEQKAMRDSVMQELPTDLKKDVTVAQDGQLMRFRFADRVLFDSGQAVLKDSGREVLSVMGKVFAAQVQTYSLIQVEGHTDDRPIHTPLFDSNWELSSARATSVVRFLEDDAHLEPRMLSATGYSQYRPLALEDSDRARQLNRRIEVVVVYTVRTDAALNK